MCAAILLGALSFFKEHVKSERNCGAAPIAYIYIERDLPGKLTYRGQSHTNNSHTHILIQKPVITGFGGRVFINAGLYCDLGGVALRMPETIGIPIQLSFSCSILDGGQDLVWRPTGWWFPYSIYTLASHRHTHKRRPCSIYIWSDVYVEP